MGFYVEPCNAGEDLRGAHVQSINLDARGSPHSNEPEEAMKVDL